MPQRNRNNRRTSGLPETSLYLPVKRYLENFGFAVKGEICGCDLVALRGEEQPRVVVGELKVGFNLELVLQGIDRTAACDDIWLAVRTSGRSGRERDPRVLKLCRLLGFGLLGVASNGRVELLVEPGPWRPRRDPKRRSRLVNEHRRRLGDPVQGGISRTPVMTAYRQQALACAALLEGGPRRTSEIRSSIPDAPRILQRNVYGWFSRVERGIYAVTPAGTIALRRWPQVPRDCRFEQQAPSQVATGRADERSAIRRASAKEVRVTPSPHPPSA
jgi:hypothetical protein